MKLNQEHKEIRVVKVPLEGFIATLVELYELGIEYIDLVVTPNVLQDSIQIHIRDDAKPKQKKLTEDDIAQLLKY